MDFKTRVSFKQWLFVFTVFCIIFLFIDYDDNRLFNQFEVWIFYCFVLIFVKLYSLFFFNAIAIKDGKILLYFSKILLFLKPIELDISKLHSVDIRASRPNSIKIEYYKTEKIIVDKKFYFTFINGDDIKTIIKYLKDKGIKVSSIGYE